MSDEEDDAVHDTNTKFYVLYLETIQLNETPPSALQCCVHWYIGDHDYSSTAFEFSAGQSTFALNNCGFIVVPDKAVAADPESNQLTLSITTWSGEHLGVFFGKPADIADSESFEKHSIDLLNEDGVFAKFNLHAACQQRWTPKEASHDVCQFMDPVKDDQAKYIWEFIAPGNKNWRGNATVLYLKNIISKTEFFFEPCIIIVV